MRRWAYLLCSLVLTIVLTGCSAESMAASTGGDDSKAFSQPLVRWDEAAEKLKETAAQIREGELPTEEGFGAEAEVIVETDTEGVWTDYDRTREDVGLLAQTEAGLLLAQSGNYSFGRLNAGEQLLYVDIVQILEHGAENVEVRIPDGYGKKDLSVIGKVFQCVMNDHPEFFYVDGYTYTKYTEGTEDGALIRVTFSGSYTMSPAKRQECEAKIQQYVSKALAPLTAEMSEYEKVKYVYEYIILHTEYNLKAKENQNICSVFLYGESVCQGYARAMQYLLKQAGIECTVVNGSVKKEGHAWNLVRIDGEYYYVDPTWGDASYKMSGGSQDVEKQRMPSINYDYLCVTTKQLLQTHTIGNVVEVPECTAEAANYYRMEDAYFTGYDRERIGALFDRAYERGETIVTLKCSDAVSYEEVKRMLLDAQEVFQYLRDANGKVAYTDNNEQLSISFWL